MSIGDEILAQIETRVELRDTRLFIDEFRACERSSSGEVMPMDPAMAARHETTSERLRHELMGVLAPRLNLIESDSFLVGSQEGDVFERAAEAEATAVLLGEFLMDDDEVLVMVRVVELPGYLILAATEGVVPHGQRPSSMKHRSRRYE